MKVFQRYVNKEAIFRLSGSEKFTILTKLRGWYIYHLLNIPIDTKYNPSFNLIMNMVKTSLSISFLHSVRSTTFWKYVARIIVL